MKNVISWDWYRDPRVLAAEEERLFRPSWQFLDYYFGADAGEAWIEDMMALDTDVGNEDAALVAAVQLGVGGSPIERGRLLPQERLIASFQRYVQSACADEVP